MSIHPGSTDTPVSALLGADCEVSFSIYGPMISAVSDIEGRLYRLCQRGSGRRWVIADQPGAADNVYADGGPGSEGFGGRTIKFDLVGGGSVEFIGPWKGNADSLFRETGQDVRDTYFTQGIIARERIAAKGFYQPDIYRGVVHHDAEAALGTFDRIPKLAQKLANELGEPLVFAKISKGGGSAGNVSPADGASTRQDGQLRDDLSPSIVTTKSGNE